MMTTMSRRLFFGSLGAMALPLAASAQSDWYADRRRREEYRRWKQAEMRRREAAARREHRQWREREWDDARERDGWARQQPWSR